MVAKALDSGDELTEVRQINEDYLVKHLSWYVGWVKSYSYLNGASIEGSLEVKLPTIRTAEVGRVREEQRRERARRKKMQVREKVAKSRNTLFFQWFVAPEGRKVGSLKQRVRSHLARCEIKNGTPLWREAHVEVKSRKHLSVETLLEVDTLKKWTPLWREAHFPVKMYKVQKLRRKSGHRCGAKHISQSKCT